MQINDDPSGRHAHINQMKWISIDLFNVYFTLESGLFCGIRINLDKWHPTITHHYIFITIEI